MTAKYVRVMQDSYKGSVTAVRCAVGLMDRFKVEVGLRQEFVCVIYAFFLVCIGNDWWTKLGSLYGKWCSQMSLQKWFTEHEMGVDLAKKLPWSVKSAEIASTNQEDTKYKLIFGSNLDPWHMDHIRLCQLF